MTEQLTWRTASGETSGGFMKYRIPARIDKPDPRPPDPGAQRGTETLKLAGEELRAPGCGPRARSTGSGR